VTRLLTIGTFDIPHVGHATFLRHCERYADRVIVGVNTDRFVTEYKGTPPIYDQNDRFQLIAGLGYGVLMNDSAGRELIYNVAPDLIAIGADWLHRDYFTQIDMTPSDFDQLGCGLLYLPYTAGISTSDIKQRLT
jgi:cytidyltransferase-like protein